MVLDRSKKGRVTKLFGQKNYLETAPKVRTRYLFPLEGRSPNTKAESRTYWRGIAMSFVMAGPVTSQQMMRPSFNSMTEFKKAAPV
jgi:hypothetical protein